MAFVAAVAMVGGGEQVPALGVGVPRAVRVPVLLACAFTRCSV